MASVIVANFDSLVVLLLLTLASDAVEFCGPSAIINTVLINAIIVFVVEKHRQYCHRCETIHAVFILLVLILPTLVFSEMAKLGWARLRAHRLDESPPL